MTMKYSNSAALASFALVLAFGATTHAQGLGNEYVCPTGNPCVKAATHISNVPWSSTQTVQIGWYDQGSNGRRLGFCVNGVKTLATTSTGAQIGVNAAGELGTDISMCGGSGVERIHTWHSWNHAPLQCGGSGSANQLRELTINHDIVVSTRDGSASYVSIGYTPTSGSDAGVYLCGGDGADTFDTNLFAWISGNAGNDDILATGSGWLFGDGGNDRIEGSQVGSYICDGSSGTDECYYCTAFNECETTIP
jgi:hypothetical protein